MKKNYFLSGEWNLTCDVCSKKIKAHEAKQRWDGLIVCTEDFEHRHPQDFVKAHTDKITVPFQRPIPSLTFTDVPYIDVNNPQCTLAGNTSIPSNALPGCSIPNTIL